MNKTKKKDFYARMTKMMIVFAILFLGILAIPNSLTNSNVEADAYYKPLDFSDTKTYPFENENSYGNLETDHYMITKNGDDYKLVLNGVRASKINLPMDVADENCSINGEGENACGTKPRRTTITIEIIGNDNLIYGRNSYEDGLNIEYVKKVIIEGDGKLTMNTTHGMGIYSDVEFNGNINYDITSLTYGIRSNHNIYLNAGTYKIVSSLDALAASEDIYLNNVEFDGKTTSYKTEYNGEETFTDKSVIYAVENVYVDKSNLTLREGSRGILGNNVTINESTIDNGGDITGYASIETRHRKGNITITDSTLNLEGGTNAIKSGSDLTITSSTINAKANSRRASVVEGNGTVTIDGTTKLNLVGIGNGLVNTLEAGVITLNKDTDTYIRITGRVVANKLDVDGYAIAGPITIKNGAKLLVLGPNMAFLDRPVFEKGSYYISAGLYAEGNEKLRYPERKSVEKFMEFYSTYRYAEIIEVEDKEYPKITGYQPGKVYCAMPTITVSDDVGISTVVVNGKQIYKFTETTDLSKTFVMPILDSPIKNITVTDVSGKVSTATLTAYNGCAVSLDKTRITIGRTTYDYDGKEKKPTVNVYYYDRKLKENADYKLKYLNNVNPGTASVEITGIIGFEGTIVKTFTINKIDNSLQANSMILNYSSKDQIVNIKVTQKGNATLNFTSNNNNVIVDKNGKITVKGGYSGSATITIKANENNIYKSASINVPITIAKLNNTLTVSNVNRNYSNSDQSFDLNVKQTGNATLTYVSNNKNIVVNNNGRVTIKKGTTGSAIITVTANENNAYKKAVKTLSVTINKIDNKVTAGNIVKNYSKNSQTFNVNAKQNGNATLTYSSNNKNITVDKNGKVTVSKGYVGNAIITITANENGGYKKASTTINVIVNKVNNTISASNFTKTYSTKNQTFKINAKQTGDAKHTYKSNNKNVTVDKNGKVTVKKKFVGSATITITSSSTTGYNSSSKKITVTVNPSKVNISKLTNVKSKKMTIKWKRNSAVSGYQIEYSTDKNFKSGVKTVTISKNSTTSKTITKLSKNKKYYVRIRTYKTVSGKKYYSSWSSVKNVKIKK